MLNDSKPWGNVLDFRGQEDEVNAAIGLFSGAAKGRAKEIWLVDPAPVVVNEFKEAVENLQTFMLKHGLECTPSDVANLKGDTAKAEFINHFKEVQKLKTQLDQYTDLSVENQQTVAELLPEDTLRGFKGSYLETAQELKRKRDKGNDVEEAVQQLDFEFVLFASAVIDYDYIMALIAKSTQTTKTKQTMTRAQLIDLISSSANLMGEREDIISYINSLKVEQSLTEQEIRDGYLAFKAAKAGQELTKMAEKHGLSPQALSVFVDGIMNRMIFDGEQLTDLLGPLELGWKARRLAEIALMEDLVPYLQKLAQGREISGLAAYE